MPAHQPLLIVLDTNVLVSALLKRASKPGQILDLVLAGKVRLALDAHILQEYQDVCARPKFNIDPSAAEAILSYLRITGLRVNAARCLTDMLQMADPGDLPFADVAISAQCDGLVTGNTRHFRGLDSTGVAVWTPSEFLEFYASSV